MTTFKSLLTKGTLLAGATCALALTASCSSEAPAPRGGAGSAGTAGAAGNGGMGAGAVGGAGGAGAGGAGVGGASGAGVGGSSAGGAGGSTPAGPPCCGGIGQCVDGANVPPDAAKNLSQDVCAAGTLCAPSTFADPTFRPAMCTSASNAEGRCVHECFTKGVGAAQFLPQDTCQQGEKCTPCYNPVDGLATGACSQNGDMPTQAPVVFPDCCNNLGKCVPKALVPADRQAQLPKDTCSGADDLCAPTVVINNPMHKFAACTANILFQMHPGACVPACLAGSQASLLAQETCQPGELCAPCVNPLTMMPTGACT